MKSINEASGLAATNEAISKGTTNQFVTFTLQEEEYGVAVLNVQEIIGYQGFTKIPNVPPFVRGVINLRGSVVPVIDLRLKFGMDEKAYDQFTVILIVEIDERVIGVLVDAVSDVITLSEADMQPTPDFSSGVRADFISAMGRMDDKLILILDVEKVFGEDVLELREAA